VTTVLETGRLVLREITLEDAGLLLDVWNDPAFIRYVGDRGIRTLEDAAEAAAIGPLQLWERYGYGPFRVALRDTDTPIGICGLFRRESLDDPDLGYAVLPDFCGKGYAYEAATAVVNYAGSELGISRLIAIISPDNQASTGLIRKLGFEFERMHTMPGDDNAAQIFGKSLNIKE
jgi:RimJ/RimL family protein N-acetyltransferase